MTTLSERFVRLLLVIHAVLLPVLFFALETVVKNGMTSAFVDDARTSARVIADNFEPLDSADPDERVIEQLDSAILGGRVVYAVLQRNQLLISSSIEVVEDPDSFHEDFAFGTHGDDVYYMSLPLEQPGAVIRLGFDEVPTREGFEKVRRTIVYVLGIYLVLAISSTAYLSSTVVRPIKSLQQASRKIASGDYQRKLSVDSQLAEIRDLSADLERMRRNLLAVSKKLRHTQRLESLGTLAGGVAHEFNNVLQPLLLYTDLALEDLPEDSPIAPNLRRVQDLANRAKGLSQQILTFGRQNEDADLEEVEIALVVEEAISMIRALVPATVELRTDIDRDSGLIECDPGQIQQLLVNLCSNALNALSRGNEHISIELGSTEVSVEFVARHPGLQPGRYVVLEVADTGSGMDAYTAARIFEPFFTTQDVGEGTGLGLSVVHGIVMRHGGEIILKTKPGKGSRFRIYLPAAVGSN